MATNTGIHVFDKALQTANVWLKEIERELHVDNPNEAYQALRASIHVLRDRLPVNEAIQLGGQLPVLISGIYYEGFKQRAKPIKYDRDEFLARIHERMEQGVEKPDPARYAGAVFRVMMRHVSPDEMEDVRRVLPENLQGLLEGAERVVSREDEEALQDAADRRSEDLEREIKNPQP